MAAQRTQNIEVAASHNLFDLFQQDSKLPIEQNLLKPQHRLIPIITIAVIAHSRRLEQPDLVIMMESTWCDTSQFRELFYGKHRPIHNCDHFLIWA